MTRRFSLATVVLGWVYAWVVGWTIRLVIQVDPQATVREDFRRPVGPFHRADASSKKLFLQPQVPRLKRPVNAIKVEVKQR